MGKKTMTLLELRRTIRDVLIDVLKEEDRFERSTTEPAPPTYRTSIAKTQPPSHSGEEMIQKVGSLRPTNPVATKTKLVKAELDKMGVSASDGDIKQWLDVLDPSERMIKTATDLAKEFSQSQGDASQNVKGAEHWEKQSVPDRPESTTSTQTFRPPKK